MLLTFPTVVSTILILALALALVLATKGWAEHGIRSFNREYEQSLGSRKEGVARGDN